MNDLIKIKVKNDQQLVSARDLHKGLEIKTRFSLWVKQNFDVFEENDDFTTVVTTTEVQNNGGIQRRKLTDYLLTLDTAKELCMMSKTTHGKQFRKYFIEVEKKWNDPQEVVRRGYAILQNENTQLKIENKTLTTQLEESNKKANYLDVILGTPDAIAITQIAADYGYGAVKFNKLLHKVGIQHRVNGQWILYKIYMGKKYTTTKPFIYKDHKAVNRTSLSTYWTQAGRKLIYDVLKQNEILPLIERDDIA